MKDIKGYVLDIGLFRTTIRSMQREVYYLPNSLFSTLAVLNVSRRGKHFRVKKVIVVRLDDAPKLSNAMSTFRSVVKNDPRVVRSLHRRVYLHLTGGQLCGEQGWPPRHGRQRVGMVRGLV